MFLGVVAMLEDELNLFCFKKSSVVSDMYFEALMAAASCLWPASSKDKDCSVWFVLISSSGSLLSSGSSSPDSQRPLIFRIRAASNSFPSLSVSTATSPEYMKSTRCFSSSKLI